MCPGQSSCAEAQHKRQQHWCCHSSCKLPIWMTCLPLRLRPNIPPEPERITAAALLAFAVFVVFLSGLTNVELIRPQCSSLCVLQEAVVQATVVNAGVGDHQAPIMVHKHGVQFTVETRDLKVSKGAVPVLDHTYTWKKEQLQVRRHRASCIWWFHENTKTNNECIDRLMNAVLVFFCVSNLPIYNIVHCAVFTVYCCI